MKYFNTRNSNEKVSASWAISHGLATDGGLYVPESLPMLSLDNIKTLGKKDYRGRALSIMKPFLDEFTEDELKAMILRAYGDNFDSAATAPVHFLDEKTAVLELWHGPTCAFKDMALQMLPHLLTASLKKCGERRKVCILVATSGDTGKAALEGFADVENTKILVFYPHNGVSDVQQLQMVTQTGDNVGVAAVRGNIDLPRADDGVDGGADQNGDIERPRQAGRRQHQSRQAQHNSRHPFIQGLLPSFWRIFPAFQRLFRRSFCPPGSRPAHSPAPRF